MKITIFGGSGFMGQALIESLYKDHTILAVARNEGNLISLKEKFPNIEIIPGDISDPWVVKKAMRGAEGVYLLSASKHVRLAETEVRMSVRTNIIGVMNVIEESFLTKPTFLLFVSTDKASQSAGVYGSQKKIGEKLIQEGERINPATKYRIVRFGNVWGSTGSIITKWRPKMEKGEEVILTEPSATRFFFTVEEAIGLIQECLDKAIDATPYIPKMKAIDMQTCLEACMKVYGNSSVKTIGLQPGENLAETMDGKVYSNQVEQFSKIEFINKFLI